MHLTLFLVLYMQEGVERVHKCDNEREAVEFASSANGAIYILAPSAISAISAMALALTGGSAE